MNLKIGIDKIGFYTPHLYVDMNKLAIARKEKPEKFIIGIGQEKMSVPPITQDAVTMAANAALEILEETDKRKIDYVIFATESGIDQSKAAAIYVHQLLGLNPNARSIEVKEACYGATAALHIAKGHIALNPESKVLVLGSDISRYGLNSSGEVTQGAGAVAILMSANPRILAIENPSAYHTEDVMDFWRPVYSDVAFVQGKYSVELYIAFFQNVWQQYKRKVGLELKDFESICFHLPYTRLGLKALKTVIDEGTDEERERLLANFELSRTYNKVVGNIYTGSLYLSLLSLLELNTEMEAGARIGLFSYGSGAVGEFFSGIVQPQYREWLHTERHAQLLASRREVCISEYEAMFQETSLSYISTGKFPIEKDPALICLAGVNDHMREYVYK
jgi:hydroxymethylglutaryl-CoA synthase